MTERLFKKLHVSPSGLSDDIGLGRAVLPDIQRPSVWASAKILVVVVAHCLGHQNATEVSA